jgi:hypothetical protein
MHQKGDTHVDTLGNSTDSATGGQNEASREEGTVTISRWVAAQLVGRLIGFNERRQENFCRCCRTPTDEYDTRLHSDEDCPALALQAALEDWP